MIFSTKSTFFALISLLALLPGTMAAPAPPFVRFRRQADAAQSSNKLDPSQVMDSLKQDGQGANVDPGQVRSLTSENNFINFCLTQQVALTNGKQVAEGSCNPTIMGRIIAADKIPSCKFVFPPNNDKSLTENTPFTIKLKIQNMQTGFFANPATNYYGAPQTVNDQGILIGHSHVVVEKLPSLDSTEPLDPLKFVFFKGLNNPAQDGILTADVTKGLAAGFYRLTSINSATTHQPALVAVAQHGHADDGVYFEVKAAGAGDNNGASSSATASATSSADPSASSAADNGNGKGGDNGKDASSTSSAAPTETGDSNNGGGKNGDNGKDASATSSAAPTETSSADDSNNNGGGKNDGKDGSNDASSTSSSAAPTETGGNNNGGGNGDNSSDNLNTFKESLGGVDPVPITKVDGQFQTDGATLPDINSAIQRACDAQRNKCADKANATGFKNGLTIEACDSQRAKCAQQNAAK